MNEDLLPCPFCGCEVELVSSKNAPERLLVIACKSPSPCIGSGLGGFYILESQRAEGIAAWNRRSTIGGEPVAWVTADILAAMKRGERVVPGWKRSADFCIPLYPHPAPSTGEGVKVKALEWLRAASSMHDAIGYGGLYRVHLRDGDWRLLVNGGFEGTFDSELTAKAAGQAHHEARVRSALEVSP